MSTNNKQLVDTTTGEIYDMSEYYLRAKSSDEAFKRKQFYLQDNRHFSFADMENIKEVISNVSTVHCGYLLILQCFMEYGTGKLKLTRKEMPKAVGASESTFIRFWTEVRSNGIVTVYNCEFYINPRFHFRCKSKSDRVIKLFTTTLKQLEDELKPSELGFLYKLLPYVYYDTNMICVDPFTEPGEIQFLNKSQIALLVEMEEKKTSKMLDKLRKAGVIAETIRQDDKRDRIFTLNPYLFYRKKGKPDVTLRGLFASTPYNK
jgi:DNA-binding MarR family transcriptional regulator